MATVETTHDKMVCYCFGLRESDIQQTVQLHGCQELQAVMNCSGAGTGCTACHRRIQAALSKQAAEAYGTAPLESAEPLTP